MTTDPKAVRALDACSLSGLALRTFWGVAQAWSLTETEQAKVLGLADGATLHSLKNDVAPHFDVETLERIHCVLAIFEGINILLQVPSRADAWLRRPNKAPTFGGQSALDTMMRGSVADLLAVRRYLEAQRW